MSTHKLKLKRTPEEEAQHQLRKERRKEKKRKQDGQGGPSSKKRREHGSSHSHVKWASSDDEEIEIGPYSAEAFNTTPNIPPSGSRARKPDYDALQAEIEQQMFREKMFDAMGDDERLDSVEARFNDYAQVPDRWRTDGGNSRQNVFEGDDFLKQDPSLMDEEEYAEWIRVGMYRKTHAEEYAEQQRQKAAKAARRAEEKARKAEAERLEKAAEEVRKLRKLESASRRLDAAREDYNARWVALLASAADGTMDIARPSENTALLSFDDIPWPIATAHHRHKAERRHRSNARSPERISVGMEDLTTDAIASFLLPDVLPPSDVDPGVKRKERKDKLRETFLRFHPDKFEGRFMRRIKEGEQAKVREAIGQVSRSLNFLMGDGD